MLYIYYIYIYKPFCCVFQKAILLILEHNGKCETGEISFRLNLYGLISNYQLYSPKNHIVVKMQTVAFNSQFKIMPFVFKIFFLQYIYLRIRDSERQDRRLDSIGSPLRCLQHQRWGLTLSQESETIQASHWKAATRLCEPLLLLPCPAWQEAKVCNKARQASVGCWGPNCWTKC